ncbi:AcaB family transcriptional regulator [Pseudomonas aeruginosa]|nr:AcaB family transcriptional regulator [Pseudomonas aeruginosa]
MAETHRLQIGSLRSDVALTLHTYHAARIWTGRQKSDAKHSILGLSGFCAYVNRMHRGQHRTIRTPTGGWFRSKRKSRAAKPHPGHRPATG